MRVAFSANSAWNLLNFRGPILRALLERGDEVFAIAPPGRESDALARLGCQLHEVSVDPKGSNPARDAALLFAYYRVYSLIRPDLALHFTVKPVVYGSLAARVVRIPVINTITGVGTAFVTEGAPTRIVEGLYRLALRGRNTVIFQNPDDLEFFRLKGLVADDHFEIVPGSGVDLERYCPASSQPDGATSFLMIARLLRDKGVREFVEAAGIVKAETKDVRFRLLGQLGAENRTAISRETLTVWTDSGVVEYLGETDDVRPFIAAAHCVVLPSYREGMPRALLEAAAMGKPLIATDVAGCRQVVQHGCNGLLCRERDSHDLAAKVMEFIRLPVAGREQMGRASRAKAEREFDEKIVARAYLDRIAKVRQGN